MSFSSQPLELTLQSAHDTNPIYKKNYSSLHKDRVFLGSLIQAQQLYSVVLSLNQIEAGLGNKLLIDLEEQARNL